MNSSFFSFAQETGKELRGIDFRELDLNQDTVNLDGEWEFFWKQLLTPEDFAEREITSPSLIEVPGAWNGLQVDGEILPGSGYATFRANFFVGENISPLGIKIPPIFSSFRIWANGEEIASSGEVAVDESGSIFQFFPQKVFFPVQGEELELIIQVSNHTYQWGGIVENLTLGKAENMIFLGERDRLYGGILFGGLFVLGLLHIFLFYFWRDWTHIFYFGLFCFFFSLFILFTGEEALATLVKNISWDWGNRIRDLSYFLGVGAFALFFKELFSPFIPRGWLAGTLIITGGFSLLTLIISPEVFRSYKIVFHILSIILGIFVFRALLLGSWKKQSGAPLMLGGSLILALTIIYDFFLTGTLSFFQGFTENYLMGAKLYKPGLLFFALLYSLALGEISFKKLEKNEQILEDLFERNEDLESQIIERIKEIEQSNDKIEQQEREIEKAHRALEKVSLRDPLTEVWNKRYFSEVLASEWERGKNRKNYLSMIYLDIDDFHGFNKKYGHRIGDQLLIKISEVLQAFTNRPGEIVSRYGGEEFVLLFPEISPERAMEIGENIRRKIEGLYLFHDSGWGYKPVTASIGIAAVVPEEGLTPENLIAQAENAMFRAKKAGKNQIASDFFFGD